MNGEPHPHKLLQGPLGGDSGGSRGLSEESEHIQLTIPMHLSPARPGLLHLWLFLLKYSIHTEKRTGSKVHRIVITEHTLVTSTQIEKPNIASTQKPPLCPLLVNTPHQG